VISTRAKQTAYLLVFAEGILLSLAFSCAFATRALVTLPTLEDGSGIDFNDHFWMLTIGVPLYWLLAWGHKLYEFAAIRGRASTVLSLTRVFAYLATVLGLAIFLAQAKGFSRAVFFLFLGFGFAFILANRLALAALARRQGVSSSEMRNVLVVGTGPESIEVRTKLAVHPEHAMRVVGHLTGPAPAPMTVDPGEVLGSLADLKRIVEERVVDDVVFAIPVAESLACEREIGWCEEVGVTVHLRVDLVRTLFARLSPTDLDGTPMLTISATPRQPVALLMKRSLDLLGAAVAMVVLSPVFGATAALVKLTSRGPVYFRQTRVGLNGRTFTLFKFRSMYRDAEARKAELAEQERALRSRLQDQARPPDHPCREVDPALLDRRATAAVERAARGHEPRRSAASDPRGGPEVRALAAAPPVDEARNHLSLAGLREERDRLRGLDEAGPGVHRHLVAPPRRLDPAPHRPRRADRPWRALKGV
jgi:hypothetical protein